MKRWLFTFMLLFPVYCIAQTYRYLGVENGLSSRQVYCIQKDNTGYMWFLTHEGIDRYNGKDFKHYKLMESGVEVNSLLNHNWMYTDGKGNLWEIGKKGRIFKYNQLRDHFECVYRLSEGSSGDSSVAPVGFGWIDRSDRIWLCGENEIVLYDTRIQKVSRLQNVLKEYILSIEQIDNNLFFIGTETGVYRAYLENGRLCVLSEKSPLENIHVQVSSLYFSPHSNRLFIGSFQQGVLVYDLKMRTVTRSSYGLSDISISRIKPLNERELLIATDGKGVYKMDIDTYKTIPYIIVDYDSSNGMNGNNINDIYVDEEERIWMANYPIGITIRNNRFPEYKWIKHSIGNKQSLVNDQVNAIIEDCDGDLWFGTNNGISLLESRTGRWSSFLSSFELTSNSQSHVFITLCEVAPDIIWAGGYSSGIYEINKRNLSIRYLTPQIYTNENISPDKYIRNIYKDSIGYIWVGGYHNLKYFDIKSKKVRLYSGLNFVTKIVERNSEEMWIGCANGLYLLNKVSGTFERIPLPVESTYIHSLYQAKDGSLYIGTNGSGLLIYKPEENKFTHYDTKNSALISDNIYTILSDNDKNILLATENGITSFNLQKRNLHNWTKEMGLMTTHFNPLSGVFRKNGNFVFGSVDGAVEFSKNIVLPQQYSSKMILSDFKLFYQTVYPGDKGSPLKADINQTRELKLKYGQNIFSLKVSSINYDYPSDIIYSWKLEGFYEEWSKPSHEDIISYTNLAPGKYTLRIRMISNEDKQMVLGERAMDIVVAQPFWLSRWAIGIYILLVSLLIIIMMRILFLRKQRKISEDKIRFFVNTAHDIRTPLTLIKAPLEDVVDREALTEEGITNIDTALRNVNALLQLTTNLINFEKADVYVPELHVSEIELNSFMNDLLEMFRPYAKAKRIDFLYESNFQFLNVRFDKDKMESILKNIISNALKYTPESGSVLVSVSDDKESWSVKVKDSGIGIPARERKRLFKLHFRGSNAINSKVIGSGIGLMLVWKLVRLHKGKINLISTENKGTTVYLSFPKDGRHLQRNFLPISQKLEVKEKMGMSDALTEINDAMRNKEGNNKKRQRILIAEDNDELRNYLSHTLSDIYAVRTCSDGKEALNIISEYKPELVISDVMMPNVKGDELCVAIKGNIETSHIPVILLTALNSDRDIIMGLQTGADDYVIKPFNIGVLKASIANLLKNRALLRQKYADLDLSNEVEEEDCPNCSKDMDWKLIANIKKHIENNMDNPAFNVDMLCSLVGMSRTSFYNKIRALTEQAPADYIRLIRLKRAARLLEEGNHTITEIAEMTGFNDAKYFREVFKKHFKMSPSQYGKENRKVK